MIDDLRLETATYQIGPSDTPPCGRVPGFQAPSLRVLGVPPEADQVSGKRNKNAETRTLKPETFITVQPILHCKHSLHDFVSSLTHTNFPLFPSTSCQYLLHPFRSRFPTKNGLKTS